MKKRVFFLISITLVVVGLFLLMQLLVNVILPKGKGALQVTSNIKAQVFLDEKKVGDTNLCLCDQDKTIKEGEYTIRLVPDDTSQKSYIAKIKINPGVLTAIEHTFLPGSYASSHMLSLEKTGEKDASIFIASIPEGALITFDGEQVGATPYDAKNISASEHEIEIHKQGFIKKTIRVKTVTGYRLVINSILGTDSGESEITLTPTPISELTTQASPSAQIKIKKTPTGFLRVRSTPSLNGNEIGRVTPGEIYTFLDEKDNWYEIELGDKKTGWVIKTYSEKISN